MSPGAIVLAAGEARRMGRPKLALPYGAGTLLSAALEPLLASPLRRIVVVLGHAADEVRRAAGSAPAGRLEFVVNQGWREGMASSLRAGLAACEDCDAVLVALGDKLGVTAALLERVLAASASAPLVVPTVAGRGSHPVLFGRALFGELRALTGDSGAREIVLRHRSEAALVAGEPLHDVDDEGDYRALLERRPPRPDDGLPLDTQVVS
jgi:molybdenum cofactor cytidylyltransferase